MKRTLLIASAALTISLSAAASTEQPAKPAATRESASTLKKTPAHIPGSEWKFKVTDSDIIRETPAGEKLLYSKACDYYANSLWGTVEASTKGMPATVVESTDGKDLYFYGPFAGLDTRTWLKGEIDGDRLTVKLPQAIYADNDGENDYIYVAQLCHFEYSDPEQTEGIYVAEEGDTEILFLKEGDSWVMQAGKEINAHPLVMGLVSADDGSWCIFSDWNMVYTPFTEELVTVPEGLDTAKWNLQISDEGDYVAGRLVNVGTDGNDIYVQGLASDFPEAWVKGTVADGKATFLSGQYLGADELTSTFGYFYGGTEEEVYNEEWDFSYMETSLADDIVFDYDAGNGRLTTDGVVVINNGTDELNASDSMSKPILVVQGEVTDFTPMDPVVTYYSEPGEYAGSLYFNFTMLNKAGQLLPASELYYRILVDGEPMEFYSDEFTGITDGVTEVPFDFTNGDTMGFYGPADNRHFMQFSFTGFDTLDLQTLCRHNGEDYESGIVNIYKSDDSGVAMSVRPEAPVSVEWYDLAGRRVATPQKGLYIRRAIFADGHSESRKQTVND